MIKWTFDRLAAFAGLLLLGWLLLVVAICKPLQRSLHRKFFI